MSVPPATAKVQLHIAAIAVMWIVLSAAHWVSALTYDKRDHCYRAWECLATRDRDYPFQPHGNYDDRSSGDLSHMAGLPWLRRHRHERFTTDEYGFRNPVGVSRKPVDVVVVGDSFAAGSYLSDNEILSDLLRREGRLRVYNYAPSPFANYLRDTRFLKRPPKWVVLLQIERNLTAKRFPTLEHATPLRLRRSKPDAAPRAATSWVKRWSSTRKELERSRAFERTLEPAYKSLLSMLGLYRFPPTIAHYDPASGFLFHADGLLPKLNPSHERREVAAAVLRIAAYARLLAQRGTRLLVAVAPDKSTLYRDRVPALAGPGLGGALEFAQQELTKVGVDHVDLLSLFQHERRVHPATDLYFADDTHMNARAHRLAYQAILQRIR